MDIRFRPITKDNWLQCSRLKVKPGQEKFVAPNFLSLAEASFYPENIPIAIYSGFELVGFLMYGFNCDEGSFWIWRFMIDQRYQGKGLGRAAMQKAIAMIQAIPEYNRIRLSYEPENSVADYLYIQV